MGARLRRSGKAGVVSMLVALALIGSAWLAYATSAPNGVSAYPPPSTTTTTVTTPPTTVPATTTTTTVPSTSPQIRIKGKGYCGSKDSLSRFQFDVRRDQNNQLRGSLHTQIGDPQKQFQGEQLTSLTVSGNTANFSINGKIQGPHLTTAEKNTTYTADVQVTDNNPDTWQISIHNGSTIYTNSCPVQGGGIVFQNTH